MNTHELAHKLLSMDNKPVLVSVDLSTCDEDANNRALGSECAGVADEDARDAVILFSIGTLNYD